MKKYSFFTGRIKKRWKKKMRKKTSFFSWFFALFWKLCRYAVFLMLLMAIVLMGIEGFQYGKQFLRDQEAQKAENFALLTEVQRLKMDLFTACQEENTTRRYLLLSDHDCQKFLGEDMVPEERTASLSENFLSFFHLFVVEREKFPEIVERMVAEKNVAVEPTEESSAPSESALDEAEFTASPEKFQEIFSAPEIFSYIESFGYAVEKESEYVFFLTEYAENSGEKIRIAKIFWNPATQKSYIEQNDSLFELSMFIEQKELISQEIAKKKQDEILADLKKMHSLGEGDEKQRENLLLVGHNEGNTDTMILVSFDHSAKKITMISLPRDLWVSGRRINALRHTFGHDVFVKQVETISGQKISGSVVVDMDVFPQVIDALGGIDFGFEVALIDPTYKTVDEGKEGTLFYEKGMRHLSGIEALRVARSRHTTSDFSRAARQQKIIQAVRKSLSQKSFLEILPLVKVVFENMETDMTPVSASKIFWETRGYTMKKGVVISNKNVLETKMLDVGRGQKAYTLLPKNGDWDVIIKFINRELARAE